MAFVWSYRGYTITHIANTKEYFISYPNDKKEPSIYTFSLEKAYNFIDEMEE